MKNRKKYLFIALALVFLVAVSALTTYSFITTAPEQTKAETASTTEKAGKDSSNSSSEAEESKNSESTINENPFNKEVATPLTEKVLQQYIHAMSHQKVEAEEKWSFYKMTEERIQFLLGQLEVEDYQHEELYRTILTKWQNKDFSTADDDHNEIWNLQGGTIGEATGLLTKAQEQQYLQQQKNER